MTTARGTDVLGSYGEVSLDWSLAAGGDPVVRTNFTAYEHRELMRFTLTFVHAGNPGAHYNQSDPATAGLALGAFPSFQLRSGAQQLNVLSFDGCQIQFSKVERWDALSPGGLQQSMPLILHSRALRAATLGPQGPDFFIAVHESQSSGGAALSAGPTAALRELPASFQYSSLLAGGDGPRASLNAYGAALLQAANKSALDPLRDSHVLAHLGYWVDNGAAYYRGGAAYNHSSGMEACLGAANCTNEDALRAVRDDATARAIPLRYFQWDDWAPLNWEWPPRAFPDGASHWLGADPYDAARPMPLSLYQGEWGGGERFLPQYRWECASGLQGCIATDPAFFAAVLRNGTAAGMVMFEQDYICSTSSLTSQTLGVGVRWFRALDEAAATATVDVQLCMMNPAHALASTLMARASNGRGTGDHVVRSAARGLPLGTSSLLIWAVGMWPSRDNVWTNRSVVIEGMPSEEGPEVQTAMAVLAGGPYGPADVAGALNRSLLMRSCRDDGVLLRVDSPATAIDQVFSSAFDSIQPLHVWSAESWLPTAPATPAGATHRATYLLGLNLDAPYSVDLARLLGGRRRSVAYEGWHGLECDACGRLVVVGDSSVLVLPAAPQLSAAALGHSLWTAAPLLHNGWALLGELGKIVGLSSRRFTHLRELEGSAQPGIEAGVSLAVGERVFVAAYQDGSCATCGAIIRTECRADQRASPRPSAFFPSDTDVPALLTCSGGKCMCQLQ